MSEHLLTLDEKVFIRSFADREGFGLSVIHKDRGKLAYEERSWEEYGPLLKQLWENYIKNGQKPQLIGYMLSDDGLVTETLHYIAPGSFSDPLGALLQLEQESFIYWLNSKKPNISARIDSEAFRYLDRELDSILQIHLERKERNRQ